jgi:hypothetical protein
MSTDPRKERRSMEERINYIVDRLLEEHGTAENYREYLRKQFGEALQDQREMSVEAVAQKADNLRGYAYHEGLNDATEAVRAAKLEDER